MSRYDDMVGLPHHVSDKHPPMSMHDRAAQFAPFAALTGFGSTVAEAERITEQRIELDESVRSSLNERLRILQAHLGEKPEITVRYFRPDERKPGGACVEHTGRLKKLDILCRLVLLTDGTEIPMEDIYAVDAPLFRKYAEDGNL